MFTSLSQEKIAFYRENGFVQLDNVLTGAEVEELRQCPGEVMAQESDKTIHTGNGGNSAYAKVLNQRVNTWRDHAGMCKFAFHPRLADMARQLTGASGIRYFHDHALWKDAGDSKATPWHQDLPKWPMEDSGALSIWIAVDDVDENNGCMKFVPKSQKLKGIKNISLSEPEDIFAYTKDKGITKEHEVCVPLKAGSCTFHNGLTFHYAHANLTNQARKAYAIIYMPDGTIFDGKKHVITSSYPLEQGKPLVTPLTPRLI